MARSPVQIIYRVPAYVAGALVLLLTIGTMIAVAMRAEVGTGLSVADWAAIQFTVTQALVSALVSVLLAIPVARALARQTFWGRGALITLLGAPFILPVIVAVLGLLAVFGRSGIVNDFLGVLGLPEVSIYGFHGVVLAHVFFNLPLATRFLLQGWLAIPAERFRLVASLNAPVSRLLEWPMLRAVVPGTFLVIFLICLTSFAVALTLGGGPGASTVETEIYYAILREFDLGRAALLACIQFSICAVAAIIAWQVTAVDGFGAGLDRVVQRWDGSRAIDFAWIGFAAVFLIVPLSMVVLKGVPGLFELPASVLNAAVRSVGVAVVSAALTVVMAMALALHGGRMVAIVGVLPLAASGLVMGTGLFLIVFPFVRPSDLALPVTALVNATLALPFALRSLAPAVESVVADYGRLADHLGMSGWVRLRLVILPRVRRPLGFALGLAAALSMGDLGVIALFANDAGATLPLAMYRLMGSYQIEAAAGAGLLLVCLSLLLFWICDRGGRVDADV
ncbi:thiamine/thiamine pyrophosphate ABC transporter permease ThiP [Yoonia sp.]|uniref:thiamine/thiamine pyrophosphate ABC transporter permease ThiP n=1 Tax=Yoonia sp. TaxID=2212373 RepID=UPI0023A2F7B5|nr:thiamine/thiamine pyrophosphate ABC transporter permease ThiP [Yoonia sp.]MDE0850609.1 thiamine/thiamine pyrophosphate ABC transporter permease ThiP [Yoonia sp.]